jgi:acetylornithine deacetylase/succinyl-diaminopimelate desuccinylase-like protein
MGKPYEPTIIGDRLYGRGASDDGYGPLSIALAIKTLQVHNIEHSRCVLIFEGAEETGDDHVLHYIKAQKDKIGKLDLIVCMDSSVGDYQHLWNLVCLRGVLNFVLDVKYLTEGVHSGQNGGIAADTFNIVRILLDRIEDSKTGKMIEPLQVKVSEDIQTKFKKAAEVIGNDIHLKKPFLTGCTHMHHKDDNYELLMRCTWMPSLAVLGINGIPDIQNAGNVLRTDLSLKLSVRLPPTLDPEKAEKAIKEAIIPNSPFGAEVTIRNVSCGVGFSSPPYPKWLEECLDVCSKHFYKTESLYYGSGGSIPLMGILSNMYPGVPLWVAGVLGPESNSHSVNEMLPISYTKNMLCVISKVIADFTSKK